jgi:cyclic-di-GMP-binding protein
MPSFDVVSEVNMQEAVNAVDQANREVSTRYDFKGTNATYELAKDVITLTAQNDFQLKQMMDILENKLIKRGIAVGSLKIGNPQINLNQARQLVTIKQGIETELAKEIVKLIKGSKLKVQTSIQGDQVRVTGAKRDDLQTVIAFLREQKIDLPLQFINFRD